MKLGWLAAALTGAAAALPVYRKGPPPGHTGGFGEPTCAVCHFDVGTPDPAGGVTVSGIPGEGFRPGERYLVRLRLNRPGLRAAGFQLSVRTEEGAQAGTLEALDDRGAVTVGERGIPYAHHTEAGTAAADSADWVVAWTPPAGNRPVHLHVAANAADGDDSPLGDHIYTAAQVLRPR